MRKQFFEYYGLTKAELDKLWKDSLIVFDANLLISLYRRPQEVRDDILNVIKTLEDRIWLPQQVGYEYHEHRLEEANRPIESIRGLVDKFKKFETEIQNGYSKNPYIDYKKIKNSLTRLITTVEKSVDEWLNKCPDFLQKDSVLEVLTNLFEGKVGDPYTQEQLEKIYKEGELRYAAKVPPGYKDCKKHDGDRHRFGDLIIWRQIIDKAKSLGKDIIFVTDDEKEDWWDMYHDNKLGPRKELIREFQNGTGGHIIWFYTTDRFLESAKSNIGETVKPKTIEESKQSIMDLYELWGRLGEPGQVSFDELSFYDTSSMNRSDTYPVSWNSHRYWEKYRKPRFLSRPNIAEGSAIGDVSTFGEQYFDKRLSLADAKGFDDSSFASISTNSDSKIESVEEKENNKNNKPAPTGE